MTRPALLIALILVPAVAAAGDARDQAAEESHAALLACLRASGAATLGAGLGACAAEERRALDDAEAAAGLHPHETDERELVDAKLLARWTPELSAALD
ncbi:hypothetical protein [Poseidonocella sp. HB161398]|uniref:hypothetical protein n=1 Tax=Poseidonocella sp. HB161398 TaxID=2320855 RepID=UPI001107C4A0|nr:hypothetical protein [Poseidonocella sp. HB161398]